jgi:hypothetical protein
MANEELIAILRSVIQDELAPIKDELQSVKLELLDTKEQMNSRFDTVEAKLSRVETSVLRIESNEPSDVMGILKQINAKLDTNRELAHKVEDLEMDLKIIKKAISPQ